MGKITIPEAEGLLHTINMGAAGEIYAYPVSVLVLCQDFVYCYGDKFTGSVAETEKQ